jgi:endonuclease/exonuclease/phosphatase family metal-dependent hydrolase
MIQLATADHPDVLCLQELPAWSVERLAEWSGMSVVAAVAALPRIGPLPSTAGIGRALTAHHAGALRSAFNGQANATLVSARLRHLAHETITLNPAGFRRRQARWLGLPLVARLAWAKERRICLAVRLAAGDGAVITVANLHATPYRPDERIPDAEVFRAAVFADAFAARGDVCVIAGDLNARAGRSWSLRELSGPEWGFSRPGPGIDHVLVRGAVAGPHVRWPDVRRRHGGALLSDHAPVEVEVA